MRRSRCSTGSARPVILFAHSQGGGIAFEVTEARPQFVKAMVSLEPGGPQFGNVDTAKVTAGPRNPEVVGVDEHALRV